MATRTFTAGSVPAQPRTVAHGGVVTRVQTYTASVDATDVLLFYGLKIPANAKVLEAKLGAVVQTASTGSVSLVFAAGLAYAGTTDLTVAFGSATFSVSWGTRNLLDNITGTSAPWPVTVSMSQDNANQFAYARLVVDAFTGSVTGSRTVVFAYAITYTMDT